MQRQALIADRVWDGTSDQPLTGTAVVIRDTRIESVVAVEALPSAAELPRRELPGCTLIPGLIDSHVHYSEPMGPAYLAAGVTTIRDVGNDLEWIIARRAMHATDLSLGPAIVCCGHLLNGPSPHWPHMGRAHADVEALRASIRHHVQRGVDQIKFYAGINFEMLTEGVAEAHRLKRFTVAHLGAVKAEAAVTTGLDEFEHLDQCSVAWAPATQEQDDVMIDLLLKYKTVINPTFVVWDRIGRTMEHSFRHDARRQWVHPCHLDIWNRFIGRYPDPDARAHFQKAIPHLKRFVRRAHARGVTTAIGTDAPFTHLVPGFSLHDELAMYADAGLKPVDALRSATSVNARVIGIDARAGRIAAGLDADLAVVRGNPLDDINDIENIVGTMRAGRWFDAAECMAVFRETCGRTPVDAFTQDLSDYVYKRV